MIYIITSKYNKLKLMKFMTLQYFKILLQVKLDKKVLKATQNYTSVFYS